MSGVARVLVPVDLSDLSRRAIEQALDMRRLWAAIVDVYYVWTGAPANAPRSDDERTLRELEAFCGSSGPAWHLFDELWELDRQGELSIRGYLTPDPSGSTVAELAADGGYHLVVAGARCDPRDLFTLHGTPRLPRSSSRACPVVSLDDGSRGRGA
jgi:nucleotide-binding universal stress UspA family protein